MTDSEYLDQRLDDQLKWYSAKSANNRSWFNRLRMLDISAAALIPFLTGLGEKVPQGNWIIGALGMAIALSTGAQSLFKFHENWIRYRGTAEQLKQEKFRYLSGSGPYANMASDERFRTLVDRVEALLASETSTWATETKQAAPAGGAGPNGQP
ncbi:DUF4231 domain-containing protein [Sphaerotilus microaerophilus]|uniref:DUF4231 domain-containing protein n=1 Tax=Sphaerotilus microaerophilus TaxID=2914710 RepID=A0ABM7YQT1_9BURK|nr:DUF4231 domain-containing protein [Sphaerotilus sp. FB-5]BDI06910.1 hypothetical protein CATMQ487_38800 [Sphaerotilus sp. FB-5]